MNETNAGLSSSRGTAAEVSNFCQAMSFFSHRHGDDDLPSRRSYRAGRDRFEQ
jgi:hypothetical protein